MRLDRDDLIKEFEFEHGRCQGYFDLMYKTLQFTFAAVIALVVLMFNSSLDKQSFVLVLHFVLPICIYVFGVMYAYNAYALAVCGERAEAIHSYLYTSNKRKLMTRQQKHLYQVISKYVVTDRKVTILSYGVPLGFYLTVPLASCLLGYSKNHSYGNWLFDMSPLLFCGIYYLLMLAIIRAIATKHFAISKIQKVNSAWYGSTLNMRHDKQKPDNSYHN